MFTSLGEKIMRIGIYDDNEKDIKDLEILLSLLMSEVNISFKITIIPDEDFLFKVIDNLDILFLDMELGDTNGIDIGTRVKELRCGCKIIITSKYQKYLIDGYKIRAERYFLKPIIKKQFMIEMNEIIKEYFYNEFGFVDEKISRNKIYIHDIAYIEFINKHTYLHCGSDVYKSPYPLKYWLSKFQDYGFAQCYKSIIVNCIYISSLKKTEVKLINDEVLPVSRHYYTSFEDEYYLRLGNNL